MRYESSGILNHLPIIFKRLQKIFKINHNMLFFYVIFIFLMALLNNSLTMTYPSASGCRSWLMPLTIQLNRRAYSPLARASRQSRALSTVRSLRICSPKTKLSILHATIRERNEQPLGKRIMAVLSSLDCTLPMNLFTKFKTVLVTT